MIDVEAVDVEAIKKQLDKPPFHKTIEEASDDLKAYGPLAGPFLNRHIVEGHFTSKNLPLFGVPNFDIRIAQRLNLSLQPTVDVLQGLLELPDWFIENGLGKVEYIESALKRSRLVWNPNAYKYFIAVTLSRIEELGRAEIDWCRVERNAPLFTNLTFDPQRDSFDPIAEGY